MSVSVAKLFRTEANANIFIVNVNRNVTTDENILSNRRRKYVLDGMKPLSDTTRILIP